MRLWLLEAIWGQTDLDSNPDPATYQRDKLGQVIETGWASVSSYVNWG